MTTVCFISGHIDLTEDEFFKYYKSKIDDAMLRNCNFVVGDSDGADFLAQKYLLKNYDINKVIIYHLFFRPKNNIDSKFKTIGGYISHNRKDSAMTKCSHEDIAYVRPLEETKKLLGKSYNPNYISATQRNIDRRK